MGESEVLTVREFVLESDFGFELLTGETGLDNVVTGIHLSDLHDPAPWLIAGSVLLTTGPVFATDPREGVRLVERVAGAAISALGVAVGHHLSHVYPEMTERARELRVPLFEIPYGVPLRTVVGYVYHTLASSDMHRLRRIVAVENNLLDSFIGERDMQSLIRNVAQILEMPVVLFDGHGRVLCASERAESDGIPERLWRVYAGLPDAVGPLGLVDAANSRYYYREVFAFGKVERLLAAGPTPPAAPEFVETCLSFLQRLQGLDLLRLRDELEVANRSRHRLLRDLLVADPASDEFPELLARVSEGGLGGRSAWRLALCKPIVSRSDRRRESRTPLQLQDALIDATDTFFGQQRMPFLDTPRGTTVAVLYPLPDNGAITDRMLLNELRASLNEALSPHAVLIGASCSLTGLSNARRGLQQAEQALLAADQGTGASDIVLHEEMSARFRLLDGQSPEALADIYSRTIAPLQEFDTAHHASLVTTLSTLFSHGLSPARAAEALYVHRNTLQKRLRRIEELLDVDLGETGDIVELYLGLRAGALLEAHGEGLPSLQADAE